VDATQLLEARKVAWDKAQALVDEAETAKRDMTAEENETFDRIMEDIDSRDQRIKQILDAEKRDRVAAATLAEIGGFRTDTVEAPAVQAENELRSFLKGESRKMELRADKPRSFNEYRTLSKLTAGAGANTVPISFYDQLIAHLIEVSGILMANPTLLNTNTGEQIQVPKTTGHSTATLTAEGSAIAASDPAFGQVPLDAFKYPVLVQVSNELLTDTGVDLMGYVAMQAGRACGNAFGAHAITGTGSAQPNGLVTAATLGITGAAAVSGAFSADNLIDLFFSVIAPYRNSPSCAWLLKDSSLANVRKLKDTTNQYLWQPSLQVGAPDTLLGKPVYTDPNIASVALSAKSVVFGDISQYFVRMVNGIRFERSDEFAFSSDLVTFRCILRADGDLVDTTGAVKYFVGNAA
jgi:HK97 family phage major capsid protein